MSGDDIIPSGGQSIGEQQFRWEPEAVTLWRGFSRPGMPWLHCKQLWPLDQMAERVLCSKIPMVRKELTVVFVKPPGGMRKSQVKSWVKGLCEVVLQTGRCPRLAFVTAVPVESEQQQIVKNFNCNLITAVRKLKNNWSGLAIVPLHQFAICSGYSIMNYDQLTADQCKSIVQAMIIMLKHEFPGLAVLRK